MVLVWYGSVFVLEEVGDEPHTPVGWSVDALFEKKSGEHTLRNLGFPSTLNASWIWPESRCESTSQGRKCIVMSPDGTGLEPTPSLLRKRLAGVYPGESLTSSACMIGEL